MISLTQVLLLVIWLGASGLIFVLALIARFYQFSSGESTYFQVYIIPAVFFSLSTARYITLDQWGGDNWGNAGWFLTGIVLIGLCLNLYQTMTKRGQG